MWTHLPRKHYLVLYEVLGVTGAAKHMAMLTVKRPELPPHPQAELVQQYPELTCQVATAAYERETPAAFRESRATWRTDALIQAAIASDPHLMPPAPWLKNEWNVCTAAACCRVMHACL